MTTRPRKAPFSLLPFITSLTRAIGSGVCDACMPSSSCVYEPARTTAISAAVLVGMKMMRISSTSRSLNRNTIGPSSAGINGSKTLSAPPTGELQLASSSPTAMPCDEKLCPAIAT